MNTIYQLCRTVILFNYTIITTGVSPTLVFPTVAPARLQLHLQSLRVANQFVLCQHVANSENKI